MVQGVFLAQEAIRLIPSSSQWVELSNVASKCLTNIRSCGDNGFSLGIWLRPEHASSDAVDRYFLSTGGQTTEGEGFYFRYLPFSEVYEVGVLENSQFWSVQFLLPNYVWSYVFFIWQRTGSLTLYVDTALIKAQSSRSLTGIAAVVSNPYATFTAGKPNHRDGGYAEASIDQIAFWDTSATPVLGKFKTFSCIQVTRLPPISFAGSLC